MDRMYGADPEFFVVSGDVEFKNTKIGYIIPPAEVFNMGMPFIMSKKGKRVAYQTDDGIIIEDGAAFEVNPNPSIYPSVLFDKINRLIDSFSVYIKKFSSELNTTRDVVGFFDTETFFKNRGKDFRDCVRFGCDPDFFPPLYKDFQLENDDPKELNVSNFSFRFSGGHSHVQNMGANDIYELNSGYAPIVFDFTVGLLLPTFVRTDNEVLFDTFRYEYYGHPGRGRLQSYGDANGYEYRPPSSLWTHSMENCEKLYTGMKVGASIVEQGLSRDFVNNFIDFIPAMWHACINLDSKLAKEILDEVCNYNEDTEVLCEFY